MTKLLVSVRSATEAVAALNGGAALIDVKEPTRGSLGRAEDATITAILRAVAGRRPVSAALGEWLENPHFVLQPGLAFSKWGLAGCLKHPTWRHELAQAVASWVTPLPSCQPVAVGYADWRLAQAPDPAAVCAFACDHHWAVFLLDTWNKDGRTLLDWLTLADIDRLCRQCRAGGVRVALAGSLGPEQIQRLLDLEPEWLAVRGAVCANRCRTATVDIKRVQQLVDMLTLTDPAARSEN